MFRIIVIVVLSLYALSCRGHKASQDLPVLNVPLNGAQKPINEFFDRIRVIPLENTSNSFVQSVEKVKLRNDTLYILDEFRKTLLLFDINGNFINKINRVGRSKEEYLNLVDFEFATSSNTLLLLDSMGWINEYDTSGKFIKHITLEKPPLNYHHIASCDSVSYALWSTVNMDLNSINIYDGLTWERTSGHFNNSQRRGMFRVGDIFHKYDGTLYYHEPLCGKVYKITPESYELAYEWDLGVLPISSKRLNESINSREDYKNFIEEYKNGTIPFSFTAQFQSDKYYCTTIMKYEGLQLITFLYDKHTGEKIILGEGENGVARVIPKYLTPEYMIALIDSRDKEGFKEYANKYDFEYSTSIDNSDNPQLIQMFFNR